MWSPIAFRFARRAAGLCWRCAPALLLCARGALADVLPPVQPLVDEGDQAGAWAARPDLQDLLCPPAFVRLDAGRRLEVHANPCAEAELSPAAGIAQEPAAITVESDAIARDDLGGQAGTPATVATRPGGRPAWASSEAAPNRASAGRQVALMRFHGGGVIITDAGSQYFFKLRGIRSIRLGARFAF